ncbi:hypothetical protein SLS62_004237 [Diatrype stigma]|uniref:Uncharacterized protein n=1 Tax=Diatrype stigma TaxID=117547 RepID=A0AAN9UUU2_9PEZI
MDVQQQHRHRRRRPFTYPNDSDNDDDGSDTGAALDEQEQEELIATLSAQNAARNAQFRQFLLALPACSALPYLVALFRGTSSSSSSSSSLLIAVLALSSLASTAWMLHALPPGVTGIAQLDAWIAGAGGGGGGIKIGRATAMATETTKAQQQQRWKSPLERHLPYLNMGLCAVLVVAGLMGAGRSSSSSSSSSSSTTGQQWGHVGLGNLPAIVYAVVLVAKVVMGGVDPERELSGLRYEYKGA